jgi:transposase
MRRHDPAKRSFGVDPVPRTCEGFRRPAAKGWCAPNSTCVGAGQFRREAIERLRRGRTPRELSESLGVGQQTLRNWRRQDQIDRHEREDGVTTDERAELARLRRENVRLRQERDLLKRAAAFFATENGTR